MRTQLYSLLTLTLSLCPALTGCGGHDCTEIYAPDQLVITFSPALRTAGAWEISVGGDETVACSVELPVADPSNVDEETCAAVDPVVADLNFSDDGTQILGLTVWESAPADVSVYIEHAGQEVTLVYLSPSYEKREPNGNGCGEQRFGEAEVTITQP